nr:LAGLIDADG family homing endonuclease [Clostridioides sp.]
MINEILLIELLNQGKTHREIAKIMKISKSTIGYQINKLGYKNLSINKRNEKFIFNKIDTKEKAYSLGFMLGDSNISEKMDVEVSIAKRDKEIADFISNSVNANVRIDNTFNKKTRRFPRCRMVKNIKDITKFTGGRLKKDRHFPRVAFGLDRYLLLGLFDADGCVTWGHRKDRDEIWHKINITSSLKILEGVQIFLYKELDINSIVRPKKDEDCYLIDISKRKDVLRFLNYIYCDDFIVLTRKYKKANALRLELEEFGGNTIKEIV